MRIRTRILIVVAFVAVIPVAVTAWTTLAVHQQAFDKQLSELRLKGAEFGAELSQTEVDGAASALIGLAQRSAHWPSLSPQERDGALWLLFGQLDDIAVVLVNDAQGALPSPMARLDVGAATGDWAQHPELDAEGGKAFHTAINAMPAPLRGVHIGNPLAVGNTVLVPLSFGVSGQEPGKPWVIGVGISLRNLCDRFQERRPPTSTAYLLDKGGRNLCSTSAALLEPGPTIPSDLGASREFRFESAGTKTIGAFASNKLGWRALMAQPLSLAEAPQNAIRNRSLFWIALGLLGACVAGVFLSGSIAKPIESLTEAASAVQSGQYDHRIELNSHDELGALASAFNSMSEEIQRWDEELNERVNLRTQELQEAQDQLIDARKMAAMASLSAGVAHEINNPLAGILTLTQVMLRKAKNGETVKDPVSALASVEKEAQRIAEIVSQMSTLNAAREEGFMDHSLNVIVESVALQHRKAADEAGVAISVCSGDNLPRIYGNASQLGDAIARIVDNGIRSMKGGGCLSLNTRKVEERLVVLEVSDTGCGIPEDLIDKVFEPFFTTKSDWKGTGLGLSVAHQVIAAHNGRIKVGSIVGEGTTFTISLPATSKRAHLL